MRCLQRNKQKIFYSLYQGKTEIIDSNGNRTGEFTINYSTPVSAKVNISANKGSNDLELFGANIVYDNVIVTEIDCPIDEHTRLWVGIPALDNDNNVLPYNYVVVKKASSLNSTTYAIRKVDVSGS